MKIFPSQLDYNYNPIEEVKGRKGICLTCKKEFIVTNERGAIPKNCNECRNLSFTEKQKKMNNIIREFLLVPGNAIMCMKSGYFHIFSGDKNVVDMDIIEGINQIRRK